MKGFPGGSHNQESTFSARDTGSIPGLGRPLERGMATHSSILAWRIPWTERLALMFKLVLEKAEEPEIKLPTSTGSSKKQESSRKKICFCFIDYAKAFVQTTINSGKL